MSINNGYNNILSAQYYDLTQIMLDAIPVGCSCFDKEYHCIACNEEMARLFKTSGKKECVEKFFELSPEYQNDGSPSREMAVLKIREAFETGFSRFEWTHRSIDGGLIPVEVTLKRVDYRNDSIVIGSAADLRELKAMLNEVGRIEFAEESNRAKSRFLAMISHEIRTPMNVILGVTEIQMQNKSLSREISKEFGMIHDSANTILHITNDILDLSKIDAGKLELIPVKYETSGLIYSTVQMNIKRFEDKTVEFKLTVDENIPAFLFGDETRIRQILNNLLSNAFKYTKEGLIELAVSIEKESAVEAAETILVFRVSDTGQGMTEAQVHEIFNAYSRFNLESNRATEGFGLGMNITRKLINIMNGDIHVESEPGRGSVFTVRLPQKTAGSAALGRELAENLRHFRITPEPDIKTTPAVHEPIPYGKVLIVDDVMMNLHVAEGLLSTYGLSVDKATSGFEAIDKIKSGCVYSIVFMDHMMPKMDGIEAAKIIREMGYNHPIVVLTANAVAGQAEMYLSNGFDGFISKPIEIDKLDALLNRFIRDKQPETAPEAASKFPEGFITGAEKIAATLESICRKPYLDDKDIMLYTINIHAIKTELEKIEESELIFVAKSLEKAGENKDAAVISAETPSFLNALRALIEKPGGSSPAAG